MIVEAAWTRTAGWRVAIASGVALILLNASLAFRNVWPTPKIRWGNALSVELAVCVLVLVVAHRWSHRLSRGILPALWVALVVGHYLDVTAPGLYGREFNVYWDSQHLGNVAAMLARAAPLWLILAAAVALVAIVAVTFVAARVCFRRLADAATTEGGRRVLGGVAAVLLVIFAAEELLDRPGWLTFSRPVTPAYIRQARFASAMLGPGVVAPVLGATPRLDHSLAHLDGADVVLLFVESYGAVTWETPAIADGLAASRTELQAAVADTGREVVSAYVEAPTFGASSWLAHLSLMSGVEVRDQYAYTSLMASRRETMVTNFARRGYRTVALMPGMRQAWPEGAFYRFDRIYGRDALEYIGPQFGWWSIPDQYALAKLDALERSRPSRPPLFVVFPTSTSHAPFGPVAPYQADWLRVLTDEPYESGDVERAMAAAPDLTNLRPSYVRAIAYEYSTLAGYLRQHSDDGLLMIAIGDHQPPAAVSGPDVPWTVPVHVFGRPGPILDQLVARGFHRGLQPRRPALGPMHALTPLLLEAF